MHTLLELVKEMSHCTTEGFFGVLGIFLFLITMIGSGIYRVKQQLKKETH
jgi:F0F1-type ATP synthase epsilon subunit